jgi:SAM-dependent methyltransferase
MRSSVPLFNELAVDYDAHFDAPHRRAYDLLAWEIVQTLLPETPGRIIDAGCGVGRWAQRLIALGHSVTGIEQAPAMAAAARARLPADRFELIEGSMEKVELPSAQADLTMALGSLQYVADPEGMIQRLAKWTRADGHVVVLVDSLVALVLELLASEKPAEALSCVKTRRGRWFQGEHYADNHQLDSNRVVTAFQRAGLTNVRAQGLLVGASALGRQRIVDRLTNHWEEQITIERQFAASPLLADLGKQLLVSGRKENRVANEFNKRSGLFGESREV